MQAKFMLTFLTLCLVKLKKGGQIMFTYYPKGVCSRQILLDFDGEIIKDCKFIGGCSGNLQGVSKLVKGRTIDEVITTLKGIQVIKKNKIKIFPLMIYH